MLYHKTKRFRSYTSFYHDKTLTKNVYFLLHYFIFHFFVSTTGACVSSRHACVFGYAFDKGQDFILERVGRGALLLTVSLCCLLTVEGSIKHNSLSGQN